MVPWDSCVYSLPETRRVVNTERSERTYSGRPVCPSARSTNGTSCACGSELPDHGGNNERTLGSKGGDFSVDFGGGLLGDTAAISTLFRREYVIYRDGGSRVAKGNSVNYCLACYRSYSKKRPRKDFEDSRQRREREKRPKYGESRYQNSGSKPFGTGTRDNKERK